MFPLFPFFSPCHPVPDADRIFQASLANAQISIPSNQASVSTMLLEGRTLLALATTMFAGGGIDQVCQVQEAGNCPAPLQRVKGLKEAHCSQHPLSQPQAGYLGLAPGWRSRGRPLGCLKGLEWGVPGNHLCEETSVLFLLQIVQKGDGREKVDAQLFRMALAPYPKLRAALFPQTTPHGISPSDLSLYHLLQVGFNATRKMWARYSGRS